MENSEQFGWFSAHKCIYLREELRCGVSQQTPIVQRAERGVNAQTFCESLINSLIANYSTDAFRRMLLGKNNLYKLNNLIFHD